MTYRHNIQPSYQTPQNRPADPRQVANSAGGYVFEADKWTRLNRWLILGAEGGSYYASQDELVKSAAQSLVDCVAEDGLRVLNLIRDISLSGRAPKNEPAIFALAYVLKKGSDTAKATAVDYVPDICRTGIHILHLASYLKSFGTGYGRAQRRAVSGWYLKKSAPDLLYQLLKYQSRDGFSHADVMKLAHMKPTNGHEPLLHWVVKGEGDIDLPLFIGYRKALAATSATEVAALVREYKLSREMVKTEWLTTPEVLTALFEDMPMHALIRNLGNLTMAGVIAPLSSIESETVKRLTNQDRISKSRLHPFAILLAYNTYKQGHGFRGSNTWTPTGKVLDALDTAFDLSFQNVKPTGKRIMAAIDISGSMTAAVANTNLSAREVGGIMMSIFLRTEPDVIPVAFGTAFHALNFGKRTSIDDIQRTLAQFSEGTDLAQPVLAASSLVENVDAILCFTDSETWAGKQHAHEALVQYRQKRNPQLRYVNLAMALNAWTVGLPEDTQFLEVTGMDANVPGIVSEFVAGNL